MNPHPFIGLHGRTADGYVGVIAYIEAGDKDHHPSIYLLLDVATSRPAIAAGTLPNFTPTDPDEARRRLSAAATPRDYLAEARATGQAMVDRALGAHELDRTARLLALMDAYGRGVRGEFPPAPVDGGVKA